MDELGAPAARACGEVMALDQCGPQPAGGCIQGNAGAGNAAAHDDDVVGFTRQSVQGPPSGSAR